MYVAEVPNRDSPPAFLLRESFRENGKVKNRTLANLSSWPRPRIDALRRLLRGELETIRTEHAALRRLADTVSGRLDKAIEELQAALEG